MFSDTIDMMDGEVLHITITDYAKPFCVRTPFAYREKLKVELDLLQQQGFIAPATMPTEWCAPIVVTPKKGSDRIRLCVDLSHLTTKLLNKYVRRERYQSSTPADAVVDIYSLSWTPSRGMDEENQLLTIRTNIIIAAWKSSWAVWVLPYRGQCGDV